MDTRALLAIAACSALTHAVAAEFRSTGERAVMIRVAGVHDLMSECPALTDSGAGSL